MEETDPPRRCPAIASNLQMCKTNEEGTPMNSTKRALKGVALAAMLTAVMLLSTGCITIIEGGAKVPYLN